MFAKTQSKNLRDQAQDLVEQITPHVENAVGNARDQLGPMIADAREKAAPYAADARERLVNDVLPAVQSTVQSTLADAREQAGPVADEARRRGLAAAAALKGEQPRKRGGKKWIALIALVGGAAVAAKKLLGDQGGSHSAYPAPTPPPTASRATHDAAGATPGEAVADSDEAPRPVTTPSDPAEVVELRDK
jgi:vacuolar-type H+-ATPase subunit H